MGSRDPAARVLADCAAAQNSHSLWTSLLHSKGGMSMHRSPRKSFGGSGNCSCGLQGYYPEWGTPVVVHRWERLESATGCCVQRSGASWSQGNGNYANLSLGAPVDLLISTFSRRILSFVHSYTHEKGTSRLCCRLPQRFLLGKPWWLQFIYILRILFELHWATCPRAERHPASTRNGHYVRHRWWRIVACEHGHHEGGDGMAAASLLFT